MPKPFVTAVTTAKCKGRYSFVGMDRRIYIPDHPGPNDGREETTRKSRCRDHARPSEPVRRADGSSLSGQEALAFLNQNGRAYEMWKRMMQAGEDYLKTALQGHTPVQIARPGANRGRIAV